MITLPKPPVESDIYDYTLIIGGVNVKVTWMHNETNGFWYLAASEVVSGRVLCDYAKVVKSAQLFEVGNTLFLVISGTLSYTKDMPNLSVIQVAKYELSTASLTRVF